MVDFKKEWSLEKRRPGSFTISNGHLYFAIHTLTDGSHGCRVQRGDDSCTLINDIPYLVTPDEAESYARWILRALNESAAMSLTADEIKKERDSDIIKQILEKAKKNS